MWPYMGCICYVTIDGLYLYVIIHGHGLFCYVTIHGLYLLCGHTWAVSVIWPYMGCICYVTIHGLYLLCDHTWAVFVMWPYMGCICYVTIHGLYLLCDHTWAVSVMSLTTHTCVCLAPHPHHCRSQHQLEVSLERAWMMIGRPVQEQLLLHKVCCPTHLVCPVTVLSVDYPVC